MNKNTVIAAVGGLLVGILLGYTIGMSKGMESASAMIKAGGGVPGALGQPMPPGAGSPPGMPPPVAAGPTPQMMAEYTQRIDMNQRIVAKDPKNAGAWIALGNDYFDTRQFQKSIDAYGAALKLQPNNPDVLTDQGVMYEQLGDYDRALANFEQASRTNPTHVQSVFNIGVVWSKHKNDPAKALAAWRKVIAIAPTSPQAAEARASVAELEKAGVR
jgi:tetratricopeptide (TPR) repeat protein